MSVTSSILVHCQYVKRRNETRTSVQCTCNRVLVRSQYVVSAFLVRCMRFVYDVLVPCTLSVRKRYDICVSGTMRAVWHIKGSLRLRSSLVSQLSER